MRAKKTTNKTDSGRYCYECFNATQATSPSFRYLDANGRGLGAVIFCTHKQCRCRAIGNACEMFRPRVFPLDGVLTWDAIEQAHGRKMR